MFTFSGSETLCDGKVSNVLLRFPVDEKGLAEEHMSKITTGDVRSKEVDRNIQQEREKAPVLGKRRLPQ